MENFIIQKERQKMRTVKQKLLGGDVPIEMYREWQDAVPRSISLRAANFSCFRLFLDLPRSVRMALMMGEVPNLDGVNLSEIFSGTAKKVMERYATLERKSRKSDEVA